MSVTWQRHYKHALLAMNIHKSHRAAGGIVNPHGKNVSKLLEALQCQNSFGRVHKGSVPDPVEPVTEHQGIKLEDPSGQLKMMVNACKQLQIRGSTAK
jgi:hypothetical protein